MSAGAASCTSALVRTARPWPSSAASFRASSAVAPAPMITSTGGPLVRGGSI